MRYIFWYNGVNKWIEAAGNTMINNQSDHQLVGKKIGVYFGTFAPLHTGHQQQIYKTAALNDGVLVIVSGYDGDRGAQIGLDLDKRFRYLREAFHDEPDIQIAKLDENGMPEMPDGWDVWTQRLFDVIREHTVSEQLTITFYVGEANYVTELSRRFPSDDGNTYVTEIADRQDIQISATMIRNNPLAYWQDINRVFRRHFTQVVTVLGAPETGKSTLTRRLARAINAPFSQEYRQGYQAQKKLSPSEFETLDYAQLLSGQYEANLKIREAADNQGLVFLDTDVLMLRVFAKLYSSQAAQDKLDPMFQAIIKHEQRDVILVTVPNPRLDETSSQQLFHTALMAQLAELGLMPKVVLLDDTGDQRDQNGYLSRYHHAIDAVKTRTGIQIKRLES